jgi:hypothetical protein
MSVNPYDVKTILLAKHAQHVVLIHFPIALFVAGGGCDGNPGTAIRAGGTANQRHSAAALRIGVRIHCNYLAGLEGTSPHATLPCGTFSLPHSARTARRRRDCADGASRVGFGAA